MHTASHFKTLQSPTAVTTSNVANHSILFRWSKMKELSKKSWFQKYAMVGYTYSFQGYLSFLKVFKFGGIQVEQKKSHNTQSSRAHFRRLKCTSYTVIQTSSRNWIVLYTAAHAESKSTGTCCSVGQCSVLIGTSAKGGYQGWRYTQDSPMLIHRWLLLTDFRGR
jgi:hypothetical protein